MRRSGSKRTKPNHLKRRSQKKRTRRAVSKLPKTRRRRNANAKINTGITSAALDEKVYSMRLRGGGKEKKATSAPDKKPHGAKGASDETHLKAPKSKLIVPSGRWNSAAQPVSLFSVPPPAFAAPAGLETVKFAILCHGINSRRVRLGYLEVPDAKLVGFGGTFVVPNDVVILIYSKPDELAELDKTAESVRNFTKGMCNGIQKPIEQYLSGENCPDHVLSEQLQDLFRFKSGILYCDASLKPEEDLAHYSSITSDTALSQIVNEIRANPQFEGKYLVINCFFCRKGWKPNPKVASLERTREADADYTEFLESSIHEPSEDLAMGPQLRRDFSPDQRVKGRPLSEQERNSSDFWDPLTGERGLPPTELWE